MFRHIINYASIQALSKILPIAGILVFSFFLTAEEIGLISLHLATIWLLATFLSVNIYSGIGRFLFSPDIDNAELLGTALITMLISALATSILWLTALGWVEQLTHLPRKVLVLQIPIAVGLIAESVLTQFSIYHKRSQLLLVIVALKSTLFIVAATLGIMLRNTGKFLGVIYADVAAAVFVMLMATVVIAPHVKLSFSTKMVKALASYSLPLIFYTLSLAALSQIDRFFIANLLNVSQVGIYSLSYTLGSLTLMAAIPLMNAFQPRFFEAMNAKETTTITNDARILTMALAVPTIIIACILPGVAHSVLPAAYSSGYGYIPLIAVGAMAQAHFLIWTRVLAFFNKTSLISAIVFAAMLLNCALNLLLIPLLGIFGAVIATSAAQITMMVILQLVLCSQSLPRQRLETELVLIVISVSIWIAFSQVSVLTQNISIQAFAAIAICTLIAKRLILLVRGL